MQLPLPSTMKQNHVGVMGSWSWKHHFLFAKRLNKEYTSGSACGLLESLVRCCFCFFFTPVTLSVLQYLNAEWYSCLSVTAKSGLRQLIIISSKIVRQPLDGQYEATYLNKTLQLAKNIASSSSNVWQAIR